MNVLYQTRATATGGRTGAASVDDGALSIALATPKELGGAGGKGANPEQLFACGYAAGFLGAIKFVARRRKLRVADESTVSAQVGIGSRDDGQGFGLDVAIEIALPGLDVATASELVEEAHIVCPYSHLAGNGLDVRLFLAA